MLVQPAASRQSPQPQWPVELQVEFGLVVHGAGHWPLVLKHGVPGQSQHTGGATQSASAAAAAAAAAAASQPTMLHHHHAHHHHHADDPWAGVTDGIAGAAAAVAAAASAGAPGAGGPGPRIRPGWRT